MNGGEEKSGSEGGVNVVTKKPMGLGCYLSFERELECNPEVRACYNSNLDLMLIQSLFVLSVPRIHAGGASAVRAARVAPLCLLLDRTF
jgi:hypothetical protein